MNTAKTIWPHLKSNERPEQPQHVHLAADGSWRWPEQSVARTMYPHLLPPEPDPREAWKEWFIHAVGFRKITRGKR